MKIYDITQELYSSTVYPGDPRPEGKRVFSTANGDVCNLTCLSMCAHNGTHADAPFHFLEDGKTLDQLPLEVFVGSCFVARHSGDVTPAHAEEILQKARGAKRILIGGPATVTAGAAEVFAAGELLLLGNESQTVGPENAPMQVHKILLGTGMALLEGVVLKDVPEGHYFLSAAPLNLAGGDGAPCRAYLIEGTGLF